MPPFVMISAALEDRVALSFREISGLIRSLRHPERQKRRPPASKREDFHLDDRLGRSILFGKFQIGDRWIWVSHSQWDGDSYPLDLQQRKEILRRTVQERLRKEARRSLLRI